MKWKREGEKMSLKINKKKKINSMGTGKQEADRNIFTAVLSGQPRKGKGRKT